MQAIVYEITDESTVLNDLDVYVNHPFIVDQDEAIMQLLSEISLSFNTYRDQYIDFFDSPEVALAIDTVNGHITDISDYYHNIELGVINGPKSVSKFMSSIEEHIVNDVNATLTEIGCHNSPVVDSAIVKLTHTFIILLIQINKIEPLKFVRRVEILSLHTHTKIYDDVTMTISAGYTSLN